MAEYQVLRVFCADDGGGGNPLAVFLEGSSVAPEGRQQAARQIGYSETVFVDDAARGEVRIFTPAAELPFAGHPLVGTAWLLACEGRAPAALHPPAGEVPARVDADRAWVAGRPEWTPPFEFEQLGSAAEVEALDGPPGGHDLIGAWAWIDEEAGALRERVFPARLGIAEDEATGAAAVALCARLGRPITIHQGQRSEIEARPLDGGAVEVGGRVAADGARTLG